MMHRKTIRLALTSLAALILGGCTVGASPDSDDGIEPRIGEPAFAERPERQGRPSRDAEPGGVIGTAISATPIDVADEGALCIYANEAPESAWLQEPTTLVSGDQVVVQVTLPECMSTSCDIDREASCDIHVEGNRLVVEASFSYVSIQQEFCTLDCGKLRATCTSPPLDEGNYEIVFADRVAPLPVPSTGEACVIDTSAECASDAECDGGFCAPTLEGEAVCKPYAQQDELCGGPWPIAMKCAPGLSCTDDPFLPDVPGVCVSTES